MDFIQINNGPFDSLRAELTESGGLTVTVTAQGGDGPPEAAQTELSTLQAQQLSTWLGGHVS